MDVWAVIIQVVTEFEVGHVQFLLIVVVVVVFFFVSFCLNGCKCMKPIFRKYGNLCRDNDFPDRLTILRNLQL